MICFKSEYLAASDERICFISGFSGSNGLAFISQSHAILWTDSRYYLQVKKRICLFNNLKRLKKNYYLDGL